MTRQPKTTKAAVVLVEDHPMFRERLAELINKEPDLEVCGEADNIRDGFDLITQRSARVAIIDISLQGSSGLELLKNLKAGERNNSRPRSLDARRIALRRTRLARRSPRLHHEERSLRQA